MLALSKSFRALGLWISMPGMLLTFFSCLKHGSLSSKQSSDQDRKKGGFPEGRHSFPAFFHHIFLTSHWLELGHIFLPKLGEILKKLILSYVSSVVLNQGQFYPSGNIWQCLETFLLVTTLGWRWYCKYRIRFHNIMCYSFVFSFSVFHF